MSRSPQLEIPQFVVIRDQTHGIHQHPTVHYVFEGEDFPLVPKDQLILVNLDKTATHVASVHSYSPHFQVTDCRLKHSTAKDQLEEGLGLMNVLIEGVSCPRVSTEPIRTMDSLKEALLDYKMRNDLAKLVFSP
ncbi:hypothetical protein BDF14DRAFT_1741002 [Spinellus fusiger]|nr:hypothetical protein BDF14DRAFT_1741002 [Spinellus fusiger]